MAKQATKAAPKSMASEIRRLILAGKTNEQIVKALRLPAAKKTWPSWYRAQAVRIEREAHGARAADALRAKLAATR